MKRKILASLIMSVFAFLLVLFSPGAVCVAQQTTFKIEIPDRDPLLPIAQVRIELNVTGASAADTLTVKHPGLPMAGQVVPLTGGPTALNGRNQIVARAGSNRVVIILRPFENLRPDPVNPALTQICVKNIGVVPDPDIWEFQYDGPNSASGHRFNSYTALSPVECTCPTVRRLGNANEPAQVTNMVPVGPANPNLGRLGIDFMFVLDKSGSMLAPIPATVIRKTDALKPAVGQAISTLQSETGPARDRLMVVYFDTGISDTGFVLRGPDATAAWNPLKPTATNDPTSPGALTAMGDGLTRAIDRWQDSAAAAQNDGVIVLLTDGMQNQGNLVLRGDALTPPLPPADPESGRLHVFNANASAYGPLRKQCFPVQSIGVGVSGAPYVTLLNQISEETGGTTGVTLGLGMDTAMMNAAIASLKGNTLTKVAEIDTSLAGGTASNPAATFELSSSVKRAIVVLSWLGAPSGMSLQINRPDSVVAPIAQRYDDPNYIVQSVDLPAAGPPGQWSATVSRTGGNTATTPYHLTVIAVEGRLSFQMAFSNNDYGTGEPIVLSASLSDNGTAITGLGNSINVRVERPQSALGSLLRAALVDPSVLTTNPPGGSPDSFPDAYARKLFNLMQNPGFIAQTQPKLDPRTFTLFDDGSPSHGDARAGDGIYSMVLLESDTHLPGTYRFRLAMDFDRPSTGRISRVEVSETEVHVKVADPVETEIFATRSTLGEFRIDVVPADRFGNFMGPGFGDRIKLTVSGGGNVAGPPVDERANGTYTFRVVGVPSGADPTLTLVVNGQPVRSGTLSQFSKPSKRFALFGGIGGNFPHGDFNTFFDSGVSTQLGFEYRFTNRVSAEGTFGFDRFPSAFVPAHVDLYRLSANVKVYPVLGTFQFGIFGGGGVYHFNPSATRGGLNIGAVGEYRINTSWSVESTYNFHNVFTSGSSTRFSTVQGGVRFRF